MLSRRHKNLKKKNENREEESCLKTENEILEIAFLLFLEKGFSEVSTNELIRAAGLTKGGFYYSFKSRDDLDQQVVEKYIRPFFSRPTE